MFSQRQASSACILLLTWGVNAALGEERCRVAGGGSCIDPSSQSLSDTTASMLQLKVDVPRESDVEEAVAELQEDVELQMGAAAQDAISGIEKIGADLVNAEKEFEETAPATIDEFAAETTEAVGEQIEQAKVQGVNAIKDVSNRAVNTIDSVADAVESKFVETAQEVKADEEIIDTVMNEKVKEADGAIDTTVDLVKQTIESVAPNDKVKRDLSKSFQQAVEPYASVAKIQLQAKQQEVAEMLHEVSRESEDLGKEFQGIAGQVKEEAQNGVNAAVARVSS